MPTGLAYLREIGMKVVNEEILKISLPPITETIDAGQVMLYNNKKFIAAIIIIIIIIKLLNLPINGKQ